MTRLMITGGQGFIGRYLAAHCLRTRADTSILCLGRSPASSTFTHKVSWGPDSLPAPLPEALRDALATGRCEYDAVDLLDRARLTRVLARFRPEAIVHLAGALRDEAPEQLVTNNVASAVSLMEAIVGARLELTRIVLGSSGGVYGNPSTFPISEHVVPYPLDPYSASKLAAENLARSLASRHGLPLTIARIFNPIGPGADERHFPATLCSQVAGIRARKRPPVLELGALGTTRDFIDVRDVAEGLALLVERGEDGQSYNLGSGREQAIETLFQKALEIADLTARVRIERMPNRAPGVLRHVADIQKLQDLGFMPRVSLEESLRDMLAYYAGPVASASATPRQRPHAARAEYAVEVQARHAYAVHVENGSFSKIPEKLLQRHPLARVAVLTDEHVQALHGHRLIEELLRHGCRATSVLVPRGEAAKSQHWASQVIEQLYQGGMDRRGLLINLGGGSICDLGGFVASSYLRGIAYVNVPTTLLAQHDAAIGGKVAVNAPWAKNFVGAFHQPAAVYCDPLLLETLDTRPLRAGIAEAIKVAICGDRELFEVLEREGPAILQRAPAALAEVVHRAVSTKIGLLSADPLEIDLRRALNLGHTFGHALETELGYENILHGEAVAFGLAVAVKIAVLRGVCNNVDAERILRVLHQYGLPPPIPRARLEASLQRLAAIRLGRGQRLLFVMPTSISSVAISDEIADSEFADAIASLARDPLFADRVIEEAA